MKPNRFLFFARSLALLFILSSCEDVIVKDISDSEVTLLSPQDSATFTTSNYTFWWNPVESAEGYQLLVVAPSLQQASLVALDTTVAKDKFVYDLPAGEYQWCVRAVNSAYQSAYSCRVIKVVK